MQHKAFVEGNFDTHFVGKYFKADSLKEEDDDEARVAAIFAAQSLKRKAIAPSTSELQDVQRAWRSNRIKFNS